MGTLSKPLPVVQTETQVEKQLLNHGSVGIIPERQARELAKIKDPEIRAQVWQQVNETANAPKPSSGTVTIKTPFRVYVCRYMY